MNLVRIFKKAAMLGCAAVISAMPLMNVYAEGESSAADTTEAADTFTDNALTYQKVDGGVYIYGCESGVTSVTVPAVIDGFDIIGVAENAFAENSTIKEIVLPDSVQYLGESAFAGCTSLETINIPDGITEIPANCFALCSVLTKCDLPDSVTKIDDYAFTSINDLSWFEFPPKVTDIGSYAFAYSNVKEDFVIPEGVANMGSMALYYCNTMKTVSVPASLESLGSLAFLGCENLKDVNVADGNTIYSDKDGIMFSKDGATLYFYGSGRDTESYTIPDGVTAVGDAVFFANKYLKKVTMPEGITYVGSAVFSNCTALTDVNIPSTLNYISESMFCDCTALENITIPNGVISIGDFAFLCCDKLKGITIPSSVTTMGEHCVGFYDDDDSNYHVVKDFEITGYKATAAKTYAKDNKVDFKSLNGIEVSPVVIGFIIGGVVMVGIVVFIIFLVKKKTEY